MTIVRILLMGLTLISLGTRVTVPETAPVLPDAAVWALGAFALWTLYGRWLKLPRALLPKRLWALAALFAGVMTLGASFAAFGTAEWITRNKLAAAAYFAGRVPLYFAGMRLVLHMLTAPGQPARPLHALKAGGALLLCWLPWYAFLFPGTVSNDSISQLKIILGLAPWSNANPVTQTALVGLFRKLGLLLGSADAGVALYCIVQAVLMAWLLGALLSEMSVGHAPKWLVRLSFCFYAFCPIFPVFAFCVGKDTNFAMAVLFLALECWRAIHREKPRFAALCIAAVACVLLRNPGVYLALLTLAFLFIRGVRQKRWLVPACAAACAAAVFGALHLAIIPALDIAPMPETEEYSIPLQQVARVAASGTFTPEQRAAVDGVIPVDEIGKVYNGELSDRVKDLWRKDATPEAKAAFWKAWPSIILDNPLTCASATFHNTYAYLYPGYVSTIKPTLLIGDQSSRTANVKGYFDFSVNPLSVPLKAFCQTLTHNALYRVLVSPGLYGWLTLFAAAWLMKGRDKRQLICAVPALFTLAGCMLSAVNGYFRYAMPLYLSSPMLLWLISQHKANS